MNFLFSNNDDDDDNFDSFITQNLKPMPPPGPYESHKKQLTTITQYTNPTQLQVPILPKSPEHDLPANQVNIWELVLLDLECKLPLHSLETQRQQFPYPLNQFYLSKVQQFKNQKIDAIICEVQFLEEYGDTYEVLLKDQTGQCKASMLSEMIVDKYDDEEPKIHYPVTSLQKKDQILLYLENVTVFSPNDFEISIVINRNNIKYAAF